MNLDQKPKSTPRKDPRRHEQTSRRWTMVDDKKPGMFQSVLAVLPNALLGFAAWAVIIVVLLRWWQG